ncbi:MAG: M15 family metallopeptidase [bacterium]
MSSALLALLALLTSPPLADADAFTCLRESHPTVIDRLDGKALVLVDDTRLVWDDGIAGKRGDVLLDGPDVNDIFTWRYAIGPGSTPPPRGEDPGRVRHRGLMDALYGKDARAVQAALVEVAWMPKHGGRPVRFHRAHGAAAALARVSAELDALPADLHRYVKITAGTFNWRPIAGTTRLSAHAHGVAIDVDVRHTDYWRWAVKREPDLPWRNRIPLAIVEVFERHGFVWGGKWHHYDTMHFEYRPELLHPRCVARR